MHKTPDFLLVTLTMVKTVKRLERAENTDRNCEAASDTTSEGLEKRASLESFWTFLPLREG